MCQFNILLRHLQPHAADDFTGQRMHAMHVLIAQETVYATGVQQAFGDVRFMQVIENGSSGKLIRFPVLDAWLLALEIAGALFQKGRGAFSLVFRGAAHAEESRFKEKPFVQCHVHALVHGLHAVLDR